MRIVTILIATLLLAACSVTPERLEQWPPVGQQANSGVGDALYKYTFTPKTTIDHYTGNTYTENDNRKVQNELL